MVNEEKRLLKVFLCHASGDKPPVRDLYKRLTAEGVDAWLDQEKLLPGQDWRLEIPRAVQEADVVVICLSKKSVTKEGYVQKEIKFALDIAEEKPEGTIFLIPARLEDCVVPERLDRWQWVDLYEENGFIKLLRSLKLRANVVGAAIEPISYEDADKERDRRLDQLYTEGLAAFYTEDWDRACHRFQTILSEQPRHKNAAEKLAEADCQRKLAKLYSQSTEAYHSENWSVAINTLEELSQKSVNYKDVAQLLKNARKQKQLEELYGEARALHAAQKWQVVLKVFDQISVIEPNYPDPEGLLSSAQKEAAETKRIEELNDLYSRAVREMDANRWYEARSLLEQVHKAQIGFLETERLLRKIENEIVKIEELDQRNIQINTLYEQAHGLIRSKSWRMALDKIEEIQGLDDQFVDEDGISEKARAELQREDGVIQRQNELAAMYAEAVRLLKEEKYQEALDKWQELKAIDSEYPDRQFVQRTAKRRLAETAKPIQIKPRFVITKSHWIGIVAFIGVAIVIAGVILSDKGSQSVIPTSASAPISTSFVPIPTTSGYADPTMYDDFNNIQYNGSYDKTKWEYWVSNAGDAPFVQENGQLIINMQRNKDLDVNLQKHQRDTLNKPTFIEVRVFIEPNANAYTLSVGIEAMNGNAFAGVSGCRISNNPDTLKQDIGCSNDYFGQYQEAPVNLNNLVPDWHTVRIEIDPNVMRTVFVIDKKRLGPFGLPQPDKLRSVSWRFSPSMHRENVNGPFPIAHFDYVRFGAIENDLSSQ